MKLFFYQLFYTGANIKGTQRAARLTQGRSPLHSFSKLIF
jgi:hypothetical protein